MLCTAAVTAVALSACPSFVSARKPPDVRAKQQLVQIVKPKAVFSAPKTKSRQVGQLRTTRPITGTQTVVPVIGRRDVAGSHWLRVIISGRPNGTTGWITTAGTRLTSTIWQLVVRTSSRRVLVYRGGRLARTFGAVVGKPSTPTPHGRFFVEENIKMVAGSAGGPYALALSARSNVLQEFEGGPGQVAIHGVANLGGAPGTAASHGCVRLQNADITWLAAHITPGVPATITP
jgi:lipoprotein-anchoring transpeptidase ErfK/SrfK